MTYEELRNKHQKEAGNFPWFAAFTDEQLETGMQELGVKSLDELYHGFGGMFYRKADHNKLVEMFEKQAHEQKEAYNDDDFLYSAILYEMNNYEYCIAREGRKEEVLEALLIEPSEAQTERFKTIWNKAKNDYYNLIFGEE